jgi:hypothetical protein
MLRFGKFPPMLPTIGPQRGCEMGIRFPGTHGLIDIDDCVGEDDTM